jgi:hypothetical protein
VVVTENISVGDLVWLEGHARPQTELDWKTDGDKHTMVVNHIACGSVRVHADIQSGRCGDQEREGLG